MDTKTIFALTLFLGVSTPFSFSQESINSSGGDARGSGGSAAYSVGQVAFTFEKGAGGSMQQGVQQAFEIFTVGTEGDWSDVSLEVFPNPVSSVLIVKLKGKGPNASHLQLFDVQGRLCQEQKTTNHVSRLDLALLPQGTYFLNVSTDQGQKTSFTIIKN